MADIIVQGLEVIIGLVPSCLVIAIIFLFFGKMVK